MNVLELKGCAPTPLAYYLKALGVLRLVAQQVDAKARGWWKHDCFYLASSLNEEGLMRFLLEDYQPTPLLAPWNNGTGFYKEDKAHRLLDWICDCRHKRFDEYTESDRANKNSASWSKRSTLKGREGTTSEVVCAELVFARP